MKVVLLEYIKPKPIINYIYIYLNLIDLKDDHVMAVDWFKCRYMTELDISCTDLSENCMLELLTKLPPLTFLAVAYCDFFTDKVRINRSCLSIRKTTLNIFMNNSIARKGF